MLAFPFLVGISLLVLLPVVLGAEDYYKILGLDRKASERDIKRAYRTLSKKFHPDKNPGNDSAHQKFVDIAEAYDVLSTSSTRKIYDQYGHEGLQQHKQGGGQRHDPFDLFSRFFGGGGHFGHSPGQRHGPNMEVRLAVTLKDFYNGRDAQFEIEKQQICDACEGSGSADGEVETCDQCGGRGAVIKKHMLAPGIFQQIQMQCDQCGGKGKKIRHPCPVCHGQRVVKKSVPLSAMIERGMPKGSKITFENEADESPDWVAGDLIITLDERTPTTFEKEDRTDGMFFRRKDNDLFWREVLSLREAWMGDWTRNITHLDGHIVQLSRKRGEVVQPFAVETVKGEGMPIWHGGHMHDHEHSDEFGNLFVEYTVVLPDQMEKGMEKDFFALWEKWRKKNGVNLDEDSGRPTTATPKDEL
ncbi:chaperone protein dnaJ 3 [Paracoccidioides lutzii Pb01]|uniref:Chaperone protein dnaJ 3 n=1 Tax=Paracoccidioides lutzii (strain ATCC MYA-826 / Pb01) TaxID=502779 RepID=C1H9U3_PARBA|nr:chaperone protein dnaJ 3 [Paracoccidioides lutzii Pb01]EEH37116.1 chaperone protein dnaJ 3 [Paracoccidioides lutzii Pb01]